MIRLTINGREVETEQGTTVLETALAAGIYIPHLCHHPNLTPVGACRLCLVEIEGIEGLPHSCLTEATEGMVVLTKSPQIDAMRLLAMELILSRHPAECTTCSQYLNCELQSVKQYIGGSEELRVRKHPKPIPENRENPLFVHDFQRCILCGRCVRACHELRGVGVLSFIGKGKETHIGTAFDRPLAEATCRFCGACVEVCPTGALRDKEELVKGKSRRAARTPCRFTCPVEIDVPRYVRLIAQGRHDEAYAVVREQLPLPSICSYICLGFCEHECRRGRINEPVAIRELKRFISEGHSGFWKEHCETPRPTGKQVAIIGSGPAGLSAAYYLVRKGHEVTVFEQAHCAGGMLRQAISRKRLPEGALEDDIREILLMGVHLEIDCGPIDLDGLFGKGFDSILLATGSTFTGPSSQWLKKQGVNLTPYGAVETGSYDMSTSREGVFAAGDAALNTITEDFAGGQRAEGSWEFFDLIIDGLTSNRGDSFRSATKAIASGKKAAQAIDRLLGGDGEIGESFAGDPEKPEGYLGRDEEFLGLPRKTAPYEPPVPQYAGLRCAEEPMDVDDAGNEAKRCLRCNLRLEIEPVKFWGDY